MKRAKRTPPDERRENILNAAIKLSIEIGYNKITRDKIAKLTNVTSSLIAYYYPRMSHVRNAVMNAAIEREIVEILAQGNKLNPPRALKIDRMAKQKVMSYLSNR